VLRAVGLQQHARAGHALASAAVLWWTSGPHRGDAIVSEDAPQAARRDRQLRVLLGDRLGHVHRVEADVRLPRQVEQPVTPVFVDAVDRAPSAVAVDERGDTVSVQPFREPTDLADRQVQDGRGLLQRQLPGR